MTKRKLMLVALSLCMVAILAMGGTLAYLTDTEDATNTFTVGNVDINLTEPNWEATGKTEAEDAYPGEPLAKDPTVTNVGSNPCFVRVKVDGLDQFVDKYGDDAMITLRYIDENNVYYDHYNTFDWEKIGDYYYYKYVLTYDGADSEYNKGLLTVTPPVFSQIVLPFDLENNEATKDILVYAEAVQAQGARASYTEVKAMSPAEIAAWFTTCMSK